MKILRLLSKIFFLSILFTFCVFKNVSSNEPVDIWSGNNAQEIDSQLEIKKKTIEENSSSIYDNLDKTVTSEINLETNIINKEKNYLVGLFDPSDNDLSLNMWELSDGDKIKKIIRRINKLNLSSDAKDLYNKIILTSAFPPKNNYKYENFLKLKIKWLIKTNDLNLIESFISINNEELDNELLKHYLDQHLSNNNLNEACDIFSNAKILNQNEYISKFKIYCLIFKNQNEIAQIQFDLLKEDGFEDKFFEKKFQYLMGYSEKVEDEISEASILDFHISHKTNPEFIFLPDENTDQNIWRYLRNNNLLLNLDEIEIENDEKIISIEKETHNGNYSEKDLLNLYTRYKFSINQLISIEDSYKLLSENQSRALLYQGFLITKDVPTKIRILKLLKESFEKNNIGNALNVELINMLESLDENEIPPDYIDFYNFYLDEKKNKNKKIKINSKIIHQSKLIKYFEDEMDITKAEKELNKMLKKIKKNQKYYLSTKDLIMIEALLSDGVKIAEKNKEYLELDSANIPTDIQVMINDGEIAMILLRLVEIIGEDNLKDLGTENLYFIISTLNKLGIDRIRNDIILKTIPLKA